MPTTYVLNDCPCCPASVCAPCTASPPVVPVSLGLTCWHEANLSTTGLSDGDPISTSTDQSSAGDDATQAGSIRPIYKTGILNGLPVYRFNGVDQYFNMDVPWPDPPFSFVFVWKANVDNVAMAGSNGNAFQYQIDDNFGISLVQKVHLVQSGNYIGHLYGNTVRATGTWYASSVSFDGGLDLGFNGYMGTDVDPCFDGDIGGGDPGNWLQNAAYLGYAPFTSTLIAPYFDGDLAMVLGYNRILTESEIRRNLCYANGKYALGLGP